MSEATITLTLNLPEGTEVPTDTERFLRFVANHLFDAAEELDRMEVEEDGSFVTRGGRTGRFTIEPGKEPGQ